MLRQSIAFLAAYVLLIGAAMYANTAWLDAGDEKFGSDGWKLYWPLWAVFYLPPAISVLVIAWSLESPIEWKAGLLWLALAVILALMETSFLLDLGSPALLVQWVGLAGLFWIVGTQRCPQSDSGARGQPHRPSQDADGSPIQ